MEPNLWVPPEYSVKSKPSLTQVSHPTNCTDEFVSNDFVRLAKWCPDGSVALAQCESGKLRMLDLPPELLHHTLSDWFTPPTKLWFPQAAPVLDFAWYPNATSRDPASFCFVTSVRECPVKLLDASDGRLRASYKIVDHRERQVAPHSLAFNPLASKLYCGFEDAIEVFDVHVPGEGTRLRTTPSKKSRDGLKGIISTLAFSPDISSGLYAAGSLNPSSSTSSNIAIFSESTGEVPVMFVGDDHQDGFGIRSSCTQVMFNPFRPYLLYACFRRHDTIYCWDLRGDLGSPIQTFSRSGEANVKRNVIETNQKMHFDVDLGGNWLAIGDEHGDVSMFDLSSPDADNVEEVVLPPRRDISPTLKYHAHDDTIGSVAFHPLRALLLSASGSRHFESTLASTSDSSENEESDVEGNEDVVDSELVQQERQLGVKKRRAKLQPAVVDNSVKLWDFGENSSTALPQ
ncbi:unnamed protein product [Somion occarium]|uniref:WD40 repeat-like protein n=1 Tax=Somion occarium TaxID=3059160 RepID=A0ABP1CS99_9APHY